MIKTHKIRAYLFRHWLELRRSIDRKADVFFFPIIDILVFGFLATYLNRSSTTPGLAAAILGGIIFWTLLYNIQRDIPFSLLDDAWSRNLFNFYASPIQIREIVFATLILSIIKALISTVIIVGLAASFFHFNLLNLGALLAFYVLNIFIFGWAFGFFTSGLILHFGTKVQAVSWSLILLVYPLSGALYPIDILPPIMVFIARVFPISYIFEGLRAFFLHGAAVSGPVALWVCILNICYLLAGVLFYLRGHKSAKRRGWYVNPT